IKITSANGRWGSCSWKNSLCFPYKIMLLPEELIDYIVVHELAHIREKNHSKNFYAEVEKYMPNYKQCIKQLKLIQKSLPKVSP
ncbi:MAG: M48 family metallopeptidase, partial [Oscillospiraceae bacterium]